jgi:hypothetical protein
VKFDIKEGQALPCRAEVKHKRMRRPNFRQNERGNVLACATGDVDGKS